MRINIDIGHIVLDSPGVAATAQDRTVFATTFTTELSRLLHQDPPTPSAFNLTRVSAEPLTLPPAGQPAEIARRMAATVAATLTTTPPALAERRPNAPGSIGRPE